MNQICAKCKNEANKLNELLLCESCDSALHKHLEKCFLENPSVAFMLTEMGKWLNDPIGDEVIKMAEEVDKAVTRKLLEKYNARIQ